MKRAPLPDQETLRSLLDYDPETGALTWRKRPVEMFTSPCAASKWNRRHAGRPAFVTTRCDGYLQGAVHRRILLAHRAIWVHVHGESPDEIDHVNGIRADNRIINLRSVDHSTNMRNAARSISNTTGVVGVSWYSRTGKWAARVEAGGQKFNLGYFDDFEAAVAARKVAEYQHGFHKNHGRADSRAA